MKSIFKMRNSRWSSFFKLKYIFVNYITFNILLNFRSLLKILSIKGCCYYKFLNNGSFLLFTFCAVSKILNKSGIFFLSIMIISHRIMWNNTIFEITVRTNYFTEPVNKMFFKYFMNLNSIDKKFFQFVLHICFFSFQVIELRFYVQLQIIIEIFKGFI